MTSGRHHPGPTGPRCPRRYKHRAFWPWPLDLARWRRQRQRDAEGLQDAKRFAELTGFFATFEIDDEAQARPSGESQVLLGDTQPLARIPNQFSDLGRRIFQGLTLNVTVREYYVLLWTKVK